MHGDVVVVEMYTIVYWTGKKIMALLIIEVQLGCFD